MKLTDYVAEFAYLEVVSPDTMEKLSQDPLFRASTPYHPAFRVSPMIGRIPYRTGKRRRRRGLLLSVSLFQGPTLRRSPASWSDGTPPAFR